MKKRKKITLNPSLKDGVLGATAGQVFEAEVLGRGLDGQAAEGINQGEMIDAQMNLPQVPVAEGIEDQMSFDEAFGLARNELGAGGIFFWRGNVYGTYFEEEWEALSGDDRQAYWNALPNNDSDVPLAEIVEGVEVEQAMTVAREMKEEIVDESIEMVVAEVVEEMDGEEDFAEEEILNTEEESSSDTDDLDWVDW